MKFVSGDLPVDPEVQQRLLRYELALATRDASGIDVDLMELITDDFLEFGASGRTWDRETIRDLLETPAGAIIATDGIRETFEVALLGGDVALVTYRTSRANRSSIWVRREGRWQLRFHQGTGTAPSTP